MYSELAGRELTEAEEIALRQVESEIERQCAEMRKGFPQERPRPCFVTESLCCGGAQILTLRWASMLPPWIREVTRIWVQEWEDGDWALAELARSDPTIPALVRDRPIDVTRWLCSAGKYHKSMAPSSTTLLLHSCDAPSHDYLYVETQDCDVLTVSHAAADANKTWMAKHHHHYKGLLRPVFHPPSAPAQVPARKLVYVGRAVEAKGFHLLPDVLARLPPDWTLEAVAGPDPNAPLDSRLATLAFCQRVEQHAKSLGVADRFSIRGMTPAIEDFAELYAGASVSILLSVMDGFPLTLIESMACGVPVVASSVGGIPESVRPGVNGYLVPPLKVEDTGGSSEYLDLVAEAVQKAAELTSSSVASTVEPWLVERWRQDIRPYLLREVGGLLEPLPGERPAITFLVQAVGDDTDALDDLLGAIAGQGDISRRVVLVGPATLQQRYEIPVLDSLPLALAGVSTPYWCLLRDDKPFRPTQELAKQATAVFDAWPVLESFTSEGVTVYRTQK